MIDFGVRRLDAALNSSRSRLNSRKRQTPHSKIQSGVKPPHSKNAVHPSLRKSDRDLLAECEVHTYRASGPGGQKRNKVESAVRIRHVPTGVAAIAEESRSQLENRPHALRRLREAIAVQVRSAVELAGYEPPDELRTVISSGGRVRLSDHNPTYPIVVAALLDLLAAHEGRVSDAAKQLVLSTHHLVQFFAEHGPVWGEANRIRQRHGLSRLKV